MTGAELLALARHKRGAGEGDADTARHLYSALALIWWQLTSEQRREVCSLLQQLVAEDMINRQVRNDYKHMQNRTNS